MKGVKAQYNLAHKGGYSGNYGSAYEGYNTEMEQSMNDDERPRVQLGVRLRIPAFRFELPRVNLPKITISAKIRQPDRPRTINLPEINLDTSSKVSAPGLGTMAGQTQVTSDNGAGYGTYTAAAASAFNKPSYQTHPKYHGRDVSSRDIVNHFSFSAGEESLASKKYRYPGRNSNYVHKQETQTDYSSSQIQPSYALAKQNSNNHYQSRDPDLGFNVPVNVDPNVLSERLSSNIIHNSDQVSAIEMMGSELTSRVANNHIEPRIQASRRGNQEILGPLRYANQHD